MREYGIVDLEQGGERALLKPRQLRREESTQTREERLTHLPLQKENGVAGIAAFLLHQLIHDPAMEDGGLLGLHQPQQPPSIDQHPRRKGSQLR